MMGYDEVLEYFKNFLVKGEKHRNYEHTVKLAQLYRKLVTGVDIDELLQRILTRESEEMFEQRKRITKHIIPSILNSLKMPFCKVCRTQPLVKKVDWDEKKTTKENAEKKAVELSEYIEKYWGGKDVTKFLEWALVDYAMVDPNAFVVTDFDAFDNRIEKAKPYPVIIPSEQVVDYKYKNNLLQYLSVQKEVKFIEGEEQKIGKQFIIFQGQNTYQFTQVSVRDEWEIQHEEEYYKLEIFEPKSDKEPAYRLGYIMDLATDGDTVVSIYHFAIPLLEKTLKINSELDLSTSMVAFPQRFAYAQRCSNQGCNRGTMPDGSICEACDGTGLAQRHGSTADVIELPMPNNPDDMFDLSKLLHYAMPPIDLLRFQDNYIEKLKAWIYSTVFNSDIFTRSEISETATAKLLESDNMNDTLYPFAVDYSNKWELTVMLIATFTDLGDGIIVDHKFPHNFGFRTLDNLMTDLSTAIQSGASSATIAAIEDDINERLYIDRPDELNKIRIKNQFNPFRGYDSQRIAFVIGTGRTTRYNEILYLNIESIFQKLEKESDTWVYDLPLVKIDELVSKEVERIIGEIDNERPERLPFRAE